MGLKKTVLAIGITLLFALFIGYGLFVIYEPPTDYNHYNECYSKYNCDMKFGCEKPIPINLSDEETKDLYEKQSNCFEDQYNSDEYIECVDQREECRKESELNSPRYFHARNSFFALMVIAALAIIVGIYLKHLEGIGSGFMGGGIVLVLWSLPYTASFWWNWNKYVKLTALGLMLILLVYLGYKKLDK
jgi:hypothetical protein